jgi:hypothetical protein
LSERRKLVQNSVLAVAEFLAVTDGEAEQLAPPVGAYPGGDHHGLGHDAALDTGLAVGKRPHQAGVAGQNSGEGWVWKVGQRGDRTQMRAAQRREHLVPDGRRWTLGRWRT